MNDFVEKAINTADLASKLTGIAVDFLSGIGCEAFCEVLDIGKDILFEAIKSGRIDLKTKKALESLDQRTIDDLKLFVAKELEKYSKKGKLPKKLKGKDLTDIFMNRLDTVSTLVNRYAEQNQLSEERKIALKYILNEIRQCTAQASLDMLEAEDKRLVLVISQIVRNTFEDYREDFAPQLSKLLFYRPTNCTYCASPGLLFDDRNGKAKCKNCGNVIQYERSEQPDLLSEAKAAFSDELQQIHGKIDKLFELGMQTLQAVQSIDGKVERFTRTSDLKSRLSLAQDRISNYEFSEACNTCRAILKEYPESVDALWCYLQAEFGIVYLRGYNESVSKPTFCYPMDRASKIRFCDHEYYKKIMLLLKDDPAQRSVYEARQREIDKAIATLKNDLSKKPEYDVFICVKIGLATDNNQVVDPNSKTVDFDQYAQRIYRELTSRGLRVFCSQISQAQGIAYDEQIWSAMLRSKKILVIGTRREYLESVWVQCEWRRWMYLRHIGVRSSDSFVTLIPSEDDWSYIRPREWDEQRITVYTDIDGAIEALIDTPAIPSMPPQASQNRQIRDIRVLLDMDQDLQDAEERLRPLLRATPSNGELRWLSLRIKTRNFSELDKITPQEVNVANRCLKDDGYNPEDNPEYRMYTELKAAKDAKLQAAKQASAQQNDSRSAAKTPPTPQRTEQSSALGTSRPQTASNSTRSTTPHVEQSAPSRTSRPQTGSYNTPSASSGTRNSSAIGSVKRSSGYRSNSFELNEVLQILMICITAISLLASVICLFLGSRNYVYVSFACAGVSCVLWLAIFISYKKSWGFDYMDGDGWMITALGTAFVWLAAVVVGIFLIVNTYGVQDMVIKDGVLVNSYLNEKTVKVPDGITEIAEDAFGQNWQFRNKKVQTIELPDSVEIISPQAFGGCSKLKEIYIGNNVRSIGAMAFHGCTGLQTIYFRGTQAEWDAIEKTEGFLMDWNSGIKDCEIVFLGDVSGE